MTVLTPLPPKLQKEVDVVLESLSLEEQVSLLAGKDFWRTVEIPGKVAGIKATDGPSGARGQYFSNGTKAAFFPSGVSLAATWNTELIHEIGVALGEETTTKKANVLLAPTACNHRSPLGGRNFESFSEDPYLAGKLAASYIHGVQSRNVAVTMKHFVANEQESRRFSVNEIIDERALREIYLRPFEIAVRDAGPWAIMSSYNQINGHHADSHPFSLKQVLRKEWGFDGLVMSDWGGTNSTVDSIKAGLDLEMPGPAHCRGEKLLKAVNESNNDPELLSAIKTGARHVLELVARTGRWGKFYEDPEEAVDKLEHRELIRKAGAQGIVLLKNNNNTLPISPDVKKVAWIGPNANETIAGGGGSANLNPHYLTNPLDSFNAAVKDKNIQVTHEIGCQTEKWVRVLPVDEGRARIGPSDSSGVGLVVDFFGGRDCEGKSVVTDIMETSSILLLDRKPSILGDQDYSTRITTYIKPETTGDHIIGVGSIGPTKVFLEGDLFIDHTNWTELGELFFMTGSEEVTKTVHLESERWYKLVAETTSKGSNQKIPDMGDNLDFSNAVGIRIGIDKVRNAQEYIDRAATLAQDSDVAVVVVGMNNEWESEGYDRHTMNLPGKQNELISAVVKANPSTIVVNQSGCAINMPWLNSIPAVLQAWYQGQEAGNALADVLLGRANPSGRLPITFPVRLEDNPSFGRFGDGGEKNEVRYAEGVYVGYRHYNSRDIPVAFPFGFGLSYTTFDIGVLRLASGSKTSWSLGGKIVVEVPVVNTGTVKGIETVQVYVAPSTPSVDRPRRELKGFGRVELEASQEGILRIELDHFTPGFFCEQKKKWRALEGQYLIEVGENVEDIVGVVRASVEQEYEWIF